MPEHCFCIGDNRSNSELKRIIGQFLPENVLGNDIVLKNYDYLGFSFETFESIVVF